MSGVCELCEAAPLTPWWFEDDVCWVAELRHPEHWHAHARRRRRF